MDKTLYGGSFLFTLSVIVGHHHLIMVYDSNYLS